MIRLAALLLVAGPATSPAVPGSIVQTERRVERDVPPALIGAARFRIVHSFGELRVLVAEGREKPRARLDLLASGSGAATERHYIELADLAIGEEPLPGAPDQRVVTIRSLFPPKEQQPAGISFAANLTIWLPEGAAVAIENSYGPRTLVERRAADVHVTSRFAAVELRDVRGDVEVDVLCAPVTLAGITGNATVRGKTARVTAERVGGRVEIRTNGDLVRIDRAGSAHVESTLTPIEVRSVVGDASIVATFGEVTATEIGGSLTIEGGNAPLVVAGVGKELTIQWKYGKVDARRVKGSATVTGSLITEMVLADVGGGAEVRCPHSPVKIAGVGGKVVAENSTRLLEIVNARGDVEASARGGQLKLQWTRLPGDGEAHEVVLEGESGGIELLLPDGASVALDLTSTSGQVDCALPGMTFSQNGGVRTGKLLLKDSKVKLQATCVGGAIRVRRAGAN